MEVEQTETEEAEVVELTQEEQEEQEEKQDQEQIAEWLADRVSQDETKEDIEYERIYSDEVETEEVEATKMKMEAPVVEEPEPEPTPRVSKAFSKVAKKERDVQQQKQELNKLKEELKPLQEAQAAANRGDMIQALEKVGWTYENATNQVLQDGKLQPTESTPAALTPEIEGRLAKLETMERQKQVDNYVQRLKTKVNNNPDYELVAAQWDNAWPTILEMQKIVANETGTVKPDDEILQEVETFYEQQTQQLAKSSKMKKLFQPDAGPPETPSESPRTRKTLRNKISASQPAKRVEPKTKRERLEAALAAASATA
jgi:hypothetical protein